MPTGWSDLIIGDPITAASFNTRMQGVVDELNALDEVAIERRSLTAQHLPSALHTWQGVQYTAGATHTYRSNAGEEPYPGFNTVAGWIVVNSTGGIAAGGPGGTQAQLTGLSINMADTKIAGIQLKANVSVREINPTTVGHNAFACFAFQYQVAGAWNSAKAGLTERYVPADVEDADTGPGLQWAPFRDAPLRTVIRNADTGNVTVTGVRLVTSVHPMSLGNTSVILGSFMLNMKVRYGGTLT